VKGKGGNNPYRHKRGKAEEGGKKKRAKKNPGEWEKTVFLLAKVGKKKRGG